MLAVRVGGDDDLAGAVCFRPGDAGAQCRTLALVGGVGLHGHAVDAQFGEDWCVGAAGSIINHEDFGARVLFAQGPGKADQRLVRLVGGYQDNHDALPAM